MAQIVSLLAGKNKNFDHQLTSLALATIHARVISGLQVSSGSVAVGKAFVECTRSNGEKIMVLFENTSPLSVDTSGNAKIFVRIPQENIDNGSLNAEDGSNIGRIERAAAYPSLNYVPLASVTGGVVTDERVMVKKKIVDARQLSNPRKPKDYFTPNR